MAMTTKEVAASMTPPMKSAAVTRYARRYGLTPKESHAGHPIWEPEDVRVFTNHHRQMGDGERCKACGQTTEAFYVEPPATQPSTDEPGEVEE